MIPVAELRSPAVGWAWHEVVALVLDAATAVSEQASSDLSDLAAVRLAADGYVVVPAGDVPEAPVLQLAQLLAALLQDLPAPEPLRRLAARYLDAAPEDDLDAFVSELSHFERPDRTAVLTQLAARAASVARDAEGPTALAALAARVREEQQAAHAAVVPKPAARRARRWSTPAVVAGVVVVTAAGLLTLAYISAPPRAAGTATQPVLARVRAGAAALIDSAAQALRSAPPEPAPAPPPAVPAPPSRSARRAAAARVERPAVVPEEAVSLRSVETYATPAEPEIIAPAVTATPDPTVYTSDDADVTPAALLRPHLPSQPPASLPGADVGTLELMVTETGRVAHVKLVSTSSRYQERMLVAAAKTWRFQPAMKNGQPVRFRARIRITV